MTTIKDSAYTKGTMNADIFGATERSLDTFALSTKYFMTGDLIGSGMTFLDVGGGGGDFAHAVYQDVNKIEATIIDPDVLAIEQGKIKYPEFEFFHDYFPSTKLEGKKYDYVSMQALFPQIPNYKEMLVALINTSRKYINISLTFKLSGQPVIDKDLSYFYYLDSGERVFQVTHNLYLLINYLCIHEFRIKKISFFGYHTPTTGDNFRDVPNQEQIKGNLLLEKFGEEEDYPARMGGASQLVGSANYKPFRPEVDIIIDNEPFQLWK